MNNTGNNKNVTLIIRWILRIIAILCTINDIYNNNNYYDFGNESERLILYVINDIIVIIKRIYYIMCI